MKAIIIKIITNRSSVMVRSFLLALQIFIFCTACGTPVIEKPAYSMVAFVGNSSAELPANNPIADVKPYVISAGDNLAIKFYATPELNDEVQVQPDGLINLGLVGSIRAFGKTPARLVQFLELAYEAELVNPKISVTVQNIRDFQVYVGGEVARPQSIELVPSMTPIEAILATGGATDAANLKHVVLIRKSIAGKPVSYEINLQSSLDSGRATVLQPLDIIYVPKTRIARLNVFMKNYIGDLLLFRGFSAGYDLNKP